MSTDPASKYSSFGINYCAERHDSYPYIDPAKADLSGKTVVVTGASRGIGHSIAVSYAKGGASTIIIAARSSLQKTSDAIEAAASAAGRVPPKVIPLTVDLTKRIEVEQAAAQIKDQAGHIDILIANSGFVERPGPITDIDADEWWNTWMVNIQGTFHTLRSFIPLMVASPNPDKTIIATSSIGAALALPGMSSYQCGKLALSRMMEFVNVEYGQKGLLAYSVHPGGVFTDNGAKMPKEFHEGLIDAPELAGDTLVALTRERRSWLAGRYFSCNWDLEELVAKKAEIEKRDLLKFRLAMGGEDPEKL